MHSPTEAKRLQAAELLRLLVYGAVPGHLREIPLAQVLPVVDAIADYSIAYGIDQLTATASAVIFRNAQPPADPQESDAPSATS